MGSRHTAIGSVDKVESARGPVTRFFVGASRLVLHGLVVAVLMGVVFGLLIGVGGTLLGIETERLYVAGGLSGWVSSFIAMMFIFLQLRRERSAGH